MTIDTRTALERRTALTADPVEQYARMVEIDTTTAAARPSADLVPGSFPAVPR